MIDETLEIKHSDFPRKPHLVAFRMEKDELRE